MKQKQLLLVAVIIIVVVVLIYSLLVINKGSKKQGMLIKTVEDLYFVEGESSWPINENSVKYWIAPINSDQVNRDLDNLEWEYADDEISSQYVNVTVLGKFEGPGQYGRAGRSYTHQLSIQKIIPAEDQEE